MGADTVLTPINPPIKCVRLVETVANALAYRVSDGRSMLMTSDGTGQSTPRSQL